MSGSGPHLPAPTCAGAVLARSGTISVHTAQAAAATLRVLDNPALAVIFEITERFRPPLSTIDKRVSLFALRTHLKMASPKICWDERWDNRNRWE
jgi:hypothetical protein